MISAGSVCLVQLNKDGCGGVETLSVSTSVRFAVGLGRTTEEVRFTEDFIGAPVLPAWLAFPTSGLERGVCKGIEAVEAVVDLAGVLRSSGSGEGSSEIT